jgi:hypothetical protein
MNIARRLACDEDKTRFGAKPEKPAPEKPAKVKTPASQAKR